MNLLGILRKDQQSNGFIDIYFYSNACWYLKQQLCYPPSMDVLDFFWTESTTSLFTICEMVIFTREIVQYHTFRFVTSKSTTKAIAGVINGKQLNIHMFENMVVPPPMQSYTYEHIRPINRVLFHPYESLCILVDSQFQLCAVSLQKSDATLISSGMVHVDKKASFLQIDWSCSDHIKAYIQCGYAGTIEEQEGKNFKLSIIGINTKPNNSLCTEYFLSDYILDNSQIFLYQARYTMGINTTTLNVDIVLNACKELLINDKVICTGVTSSLLFKKYLIWTTAAGMLYCIQDKQFNVFTDLSNIFARSIEQGSRIVCCNNMTPPKIVMQLPRGNLETISCKMITIDIIDEMLSKNEWRSVLEIMRMEKINWNVLVDLNPNRFCDHIEDFVRAAKYCNILTAVVCNFELNGNCFQNVYKNYSLNYVVQSNLNKKCIIEKILDLLCAKNCVNNLNCIVAIQQKHISLKSALISVKQVYAADMNKHEAVCNKAIRQLLQQAHFKDILNESFTLFDLPFLALIYRNSNEDPKVYGPELTNLYNMDELEQRFRLCMKSYNLNSAVKYLLRCDKFDDEYIVSFITKNKLEQVAYDSICNNTASHKVQLVSKLFAKRLAIEGKYSEAGFILKRTCLLEESLQYYQKALEWKEVTMLINTLNYTEEKKNLILEHMACECIKVNNLEDALIIFEYYVKDYKKAIKYLVEYKAFRKAVNMAKTYNEVDYLSKSVIVFYWDKLKSVLSNLDRV